MYRHTHTHTNKQFLNKQPVYTAGGRRHCYIKRGDCCGVPDSVLYPTPTPAAISGKIHHILTLQINCHPCIMNIISTVQ